ncbi:tRNA (uracil) methyltransferase [Aspergillus ibericus CBS 121593]|uniref:tRNA (uracil-O(2)-)-methyltransferase n=1 Tax=Aspergillus ibericus CBS 121593 TaxID=1448316 RepID=A0A395GNI4_9EURO|nr:DUF1613 domain protein [Aspergillus ibericus CBS 121593]RAK96912.1 DUF1613 domain protein [Aspergillus ibericus CBS 121593]
MVIGRPWRQNPEFGAGGGSSPFLRILSGVFWHSGTPRSPFRHSDAWSQGLLAHYDVQKYFVYNTLSHDYKVPGILHSRIPWRGMSWCLQTMTGNKRTNPRDVTRLSGKPLAETLEPASVLETNTEPWVTSQDLTEYGLSFKPEVILDMTLFLLANPNMSSSHLYRADILFDSLGVLKTPQQKEQSFAQAGNSNLETTVAADENVEPITAREFSGFTLVRTVVRRLVPRNPNLDRVMDQTCHFYEANTPPQRTDKSADSDAQPINRSLVIYTPHITSKEDMPFYHPLLRSLAFLYDYNPNTPETASGPGTMSIHFLQFPDEPIQNRLERTLQALLTIQIRLARGTRLTGKPEGGSQNPVKDNVIPQHLVQNTYTRLKAKYASELCQNWVESTEPSKHVFEDLSITAFLIELWRSMYGAVPADEQNTTTTTTTTTDQDPPKRPFPGFVDVACGNGVLVYVLLMEGYTGWGFDARRRKTWSIFPESVRSRLHEEIYIPEPFATATPSLLDQLTIKSHTGTFPKDTFIISNHADELTVWTPLMALLLSPESPSPFIAIPCCSHSLSGAKFRYPPPKAPKVKSDKKDPVSLAEGTEAENPASGDLKSLRKEKQDAQQTEAGFLKSMYGSLTAKTMSVAEEIGYEVERTLLRIPSTRNMAVIGGRKRTTQEWKDESHGVDADIKGDGNGEAVLERVMEVVRRECSREGGVDEAAKIWVERAKGLNKGSGSGKQGGH